MRQIWYKKRAMCYLCDPLQSQMLPDAAKKECPGYEAKLHLVVRLRFWSSGEGGVNLSLALLVNVDPKW